MSREEWQELKKQAEDAGYDGANGWGKEALEDFLTAPKEEVDSADASAPEPDDPEVKETVSAGGEDIVPDEAKAAGAICDSLQKIDDPLFSKKLFLKDLKEQLREAAEKIKDLKAKKKAKWNEMEVETLHTVQKKLRAEFDAIKVDIFTTEREWKRLRQKVDVTVAQVEFEESVAAS